MTIHYHGTPITPRSVIEKLKGHNFCVSHAAPSQIEWCDTHGQTLMLDNGAFSKWKSGRATDWAAYYDWCDRWLDRPTTWAVIPDVIDGSEEEQDALLAGWPFGDRGVPVWHVNESIERAFRLIDTHPLVCFGSSGVFATIPSDAFNARMDNVWEIFAQKYTRPPKIHMLRGMQLVRWHWPFYSVDSTDVARNFWRNAASLDEKHQTAILKTKAWDEVQCPGVFHNTEKRIEKVKNISLEDLG